MIIVEQGKVVEVCAEPGQFTYDASTEPSIFAGSLGEGIHRTFDTVKKRFTFGGDTGKDQRVYYFNTKELVDNKFGTANPIPFRVVDRNIGLDIDVSVRCNGVYSYKIVDPLLFYTNVCGNVEQQYDREEIEVQLKTEFVSALQPAFAKISELQIRPSAIPGHVLELCDAMNEALTKKWQQTRGLAVVSIAMNPVTLPEEDAQLIKDAQKNAILRDPTMAAATLAGAQADAMKSAASNTAGAMTGFMGMGMAQQAGGINAQSLYAMGQQQQMAAQQAAANAAAQIKAQKAVKQVRNQINRHTNCDTANLSKTARANAQTLKAIRFLKEQNALETLPEVLQDAAAKRLAYPDLSLTALCACFDPAVSKSGLSHRMKKLESLADTLRQRLEQEAEEVKA